MKNISAFLILILSITLCVQTYLVIENRINPVRDLILLIGQAAYCFTMIGIAISHLVLSHRKKELKEVILKDLSLVSAIASMLSLQRAMLGTFTRQDNGFIMKMEAASGAGAFLVFLLIALHLFRAKENPQD